MSQELSHSDLVRRAVVYLRRRRCVIYGTEINATNEHPDAIGWDCWGNSILVECKTSRSDYFADAKKPFRGQEAGMGRERLYLVPQGLITKDELPEHWGLIEIRGRRTTCVVAPKARPVWDRNADTQALLHLARRACDYNPSALYNKIEEQRAKQRQVAREEREYRAQLEAQRKADLARIREQYGGTLADTLQLRESKP